MPYTIYKMALPPTIPTSFVPHSAVRDRQFRADYSGAFGFLAYTILGFAFLLSVGVFFYGRILTADKVAKDKEIASELAKIDTRAVETFVRLRDRLVSSQSLLNDHVAFTGFFEAFEKLVPTTVRFSSLNLSFDATGAPKIEGTGVAKSFNALAAASEGFAADGRIKDAIFSHLTVSNKDNSVSFSLAAALDPKLISFSP